MPCSFGHECALKKRGILLIAGIDEAGRGPLAGPVVAAAVVFLKHRRFNGLDDSKKLSPELRSELFARITSASHVRWAVSVQSVSTIDTINILRATHRAMREAISWLPSRPEHVLIDGLPVPNFPFPQTAVIGGDQLSLSIAAASVIAKVTRDRIMHKLDTLYPQYGFGRHKGYATPEHLAALRKHGPSPLHRFSFSPVAQPELF
jgi:ribonuclease HII